MEITILIPTYNRGEIIALAIDSILANKFKGRFEIVVIDDGSDGQNIEWLRKIEKMDKRVKIFYRKHLGPAGARNFGIAKAKGEIIIFLNDDTIVKNDFLRRHWQFHQTRSGMGKTVIGEMVEDPVMIKNTAMVWLTEASQMHFKYKAIDGKRNLVLMPWYYFWTCNVSVKREFLFNNKLKFDEAFTVPAWEDVDFGYRAKLAGMKLYLDKKLKTIHHHELNYEDIKKRFFTHGRGLFYIQKKLPTGLLPPLAKKHYRVLAKIFFYVACPPIILDLINKWLVRSKKLNNYLMQLVIIREKLKGYDYEANAAAKM
ncbi:MAG: glycosyltransferase [Candidatus Shapirobacteria bacterium]|jgi:glycosyltransferase involved in cell wall biosynthesis